MYIYIPVHTYTNIYICIYVYIYIYIPPATPPPTSSFAQDAKGRVRQPETNKKYHRHTTD